MGDEMKTDPEFSGGWKSIIGVIILIVCMWFAGWELFKLALRIALGR